MIHGRGEFIPARCLNILRQNGQFWPLEVRAGVHVRDVAELKEFLRKCYKEYQATGQVCYRGKKELVARYGHREMAKKFAEVLGLTLSSK